MSVPVLQLPTGTYIPLSKWELEVCFVLFPGAISTGKELDVHVLQERQGLKVLCALIYVLCASCHLQTPTSDGVTSRIKVRTVAINQTGRIGR